MTARIIRAEHVRPWSAMHIRGARIASFCIGLGLLIIAVYLLLSRREVLWQAWSHAGAAPWWLVALSLALPAANWLATTALFRILMARFGRVGRVEMAALIGASWLFNYLPVKPGLIGRVAYHAGVNGIPVRHSVRAIAESIALGAASITALLLVALFAAGAEANPRGILAVLAPAAIAAIAAAVAGAFGLPGRAVLAALAVRCLDAAIWAGRYFVVCRIVGRPVTWAEAGALAGVAQAAMLVPLVGNGLGLRELAVGAVAGVLPSWAGAEPRDGFAVAVAADLVNRAAEVIPSLLAGLWGSWWVARRIAAGVGGTGDTWGVGGTVGGVGGAVATTPVLCEPDSIKNQPASDDP